MYPDISNPRIVEAMMRGVIEANATPAQRAEIGRRAMLRTVMRRAWWIAREAARIFGGNSVDYFSGALRQAWAEQRGEVDGLNADRTLRHIEARQRRASGMRFGQRAGGQHGRLWYASAVGW